MQARSLTLFLGLVLNATGFASTAFAVEPEPPPEPARLRYVRSPGTVRACPEEQFFRDAVASHLGGRDVFLPIAPKRITLTVRRVRGFTALVRWEDADGKLLDARDFSSHLCGEAVETMALIVSIMLRPLVYVAPPPPPPAPTLPPPPPLPGPPSPVRPVSPRPGIVVDFGPRGAFATLPAVVAGGFGGSVGLRWPRFSLAVDAWSYFPASTALTGGRTISVSLVSAAFVPCLRVGWIMGCGLLAGGFVTEIGMLGSQREAYGFGAVGLRAGVEIPLASPFSVRVAGDIQAPVVRRSEVVGTATVWTMPPLSEAFDARLAVTF